MSAPARSLADIRSDVCNATLIGLLAFALPGLAASLWRITERGWLPVMGLHIALFAMLTLIVALRRRLPYLLRAGTLLAIQFALGAGGVFTAGLLSSVTSYLVGSSVLAACLFGMRIGIATMTAMLVMILAAYLRFATGLVALPDLAQFAFKPTTWLMAAGAASVSCIGPLIAVARFSADLEQERARAERANAAKSDFLAVMSHELRTPLTGILGIADLLHTNPPAEEQRVWLRRLTQSARSLMDLLNDVLDFSKIEAGQMAIERIPFVPADVVDAVRSLMQPAATQKNLALAWNLVDTDAPVVGDPTRIRQILVNLVGNAIKFTDHGSVTVTVTCERGADGPHVILDVADTGIGIAPEKLDSLFEAFTQGDAGTTRRFGGTGLGLAICRRLTESMDGTISARSTLGQGSTFTVDIPLREADPAAVPVRRDFAIAGSTRKGRLLVAEDVETSRQVLVAMLERMGHSVETAADGALALEMAKHRDFDLILMDMQMPLLDGAAATQAIRALGGNRSRIPIIALSADVLRESHDRFRAAGVSAVLSKPIDWAALGAEIEHQMAATGGASASPPRKGPAHEPREEPTPVLDEAMLLDLAKAVGTGPLADLIDSFRKNLAPYGEQLTAAITGGDLKEIGRMAHALKGLCAQFGAAQASALMRRIEVKELSLEEIRARMPEIKESIAAAAAAALVFRDSLRAGAVEAGVEAQS
ncbi:MAG: ATP-binding protein [Candidatus Binataceae bacterium]